MAMLKSAHGEHCYTNNEIGVKKLHTTINNGKSENKKPINASAILIKRKGNVFDLCVVTSRRWKSRFVFPKGKILKNEKLKQTALRETIEKAGVSGELIDYPIIHRVKGNGDNSGGKKVLFMQFR